MSSSQAFILFFWTMGAFIISLTPHVKSTVAYIIAQTSYKIWVVRMFSFIIIEIAWIGFLGYIIMDHFIFSKRKNILEDSYDPREQHWDVINARLNKNFGGDLLHDGFLDTADIDYDEEILNARADKIRERIKLDEVWYISPGGKIRKSR